MSEKINHQRNQSNPLKNSNYFKTSKAKTNNFFKNTRVDSCSHIIVKNGISLAVSFPIKNQKGKSLNNYKHVPQRSSELKSIYKSDYNIHLNLHVGMSSKPLIKYNPTSYRNRLAIGGIIMPHKNKSIVEIGDRG